jgi:hypothetical protein
VRTPKPPPLIFQQITPRSMSLQTPLPWQQLPGFQQCPSGLYTVMTSVSQLTHLRVYHHHTHNPHSCPISQCESLACSAMTRCTSPIYLVPKITLLKVRARTLSDGIPRLSYRNDPPYVSSALADFHVTDVTARWSLLYNFYADRLLSLTMLPPPVYQTREFFCDQTVLLQFKHLNHRDEVVCS